jgi:hypothetical protein
VRYANQLPVLFVASKRDKPHWRAQDPGVSGARLPSDPCGSQGFLVSKKIAPWSAASANPA